MVVEDKVAVITGAASGIGRETANRYANHGASVVVADVDEERGRRTVDEIESAGGSAIFVRTDVSNEADVRELMEAAVEEYGGLDVVFNNAGIEGPLAELTDWEAGDFQQVVDINLKGVFFGMKYGIEALLASGGGSIINTSSIGSEAGIAGRSIYCATKAGVNGMTRAAAVEYAEDGIRVNTILPGIIDTPMQQRSTAERDTRRLQLDASEAMEGTGGPEDIANAALFLGSDLSSRITGVQLPVDGGLLARP